MRDKPRRLPYRRHRQACLPLRLVVMAQCAYDGRYVLRRHVPRRFTIVHRVHFGQPDLVIISAHSRKTTFARNDDEVAIAVARPRRATDGMMLVHSDPQE